MSNVFETCFHCVIVPGMGDRPTINDIAAAAGVSVATVSKAMNGRYGVATATAERVMRIVEEMGYESSLAAKRMRGVRTGVIGVLVAEFEPFSAEILKGVSDAAHRLHFDVLAYSGAYGSESAGWESRSLRRLSGNLIDGAILVTPSTHIASSEIPIVGVDPHAGPEDGPTVEADSFGGAVTATRYLIELGHRRIGFVAGRPDLRSSRARDAGYRRALANAGIAYLPQLTRTGFYDREAARRMAHELLGSTARPTAVFAANDLSAIAIAEVAAERGLDVPGDLSIVGFDDIPEASRWSPALTTVRQPMRRLGEEAVGMLASLMNGEEPETIHTLLPTRLIIRSTTAPPRA